MFERYKNRPSHPCCSFEKSSGREKSLYNSQATHGPLQPDFPRRNKYRNFIAVVSGTNQQLWYTCDSDIVFMRYFFSSATSFRYDGREPKMGVLHATRARARCVEKGHVMYVPRSGADSLSNDDRCAECQRKLEEAQTSSTSSTCKTRNSLGSSLPRPFMGVWSHTALWTNRSRPRTDPFFSAIPALSSISAISRQSEPELKRASTQLELYLPVVPSIPSLFICVPFSFIPSFLLVGTPSYSVIAQPFYQHPTVTGTGEIEEPFVSSNDAI